LRALIDQFFVNKGDAPQAANLQKEAQKKEKWHEKVK
jgi:hypothetical protein